jgi:hypothetical protein
MPAASRLLRFSASALVVSWRLASINWASPTARRIGPARIRVLSPNTVDASWRCERSALAARESGREPTPRPGTRENRGMIATPVLRSPTQRLTDPAIDPAPLLVQSPDLEAALVLPAAPSCRSPPAELLRASVNTRARPSCGKRRDGAGPCEADCPLLPVEQVDEILAGTSDRSRRSMPRVQEQPSRARFALLDPNSHPELQEPDTVNIDEASLPQAQSTAWQWEIVTLTLTVVRIDRLRGGAWVEPLLPGHHAGTFGWCDWSAYWRLPATHRGRCCGRLRRDFPRLVARGGVAPRLGRWTLVDSQRSLLLWHGPRRGQRLSAGLPPGLLPLQARPALSSCGLGLTTRTTKPYPSSHRKGARPSHTQPGRGTRIRATMRQHECFPRPSSGISRGSALTMGPAVAPRPGCRPCQHAALDRCCHLRGSSSRWSPPHRSPTHRRPGT